MTVLCFGNLGVCVEGFTTESLYDLLALHDLAELLDERCVRDNNVLDKNMYLQSELLGPCREYTTLNVHAAYIRYVTDMDTFLLIIRTGILNADVANNLVDELYSQGLIKPMDQL